jgi:hypothetical protein
MPELALTYRLCEVGSKRLDPRQLAGQLAETSARGVEITKTRNQLYALADLAPEAHEEHSRRATEILTVLGLQASGAPADEHRILAHAAAALSGVLNEEGWHTSARDTGATSNHFLIERGDSSAPLFVRIAANADWLYPDAPALWRHLEDAASIGAHPVIVARKVAPVTFSLMATLNARALQFYDLLVAAKIDDTAQASAGIVGLPRLRTAIELGTHAVTG